MNFCDSIIHVYLISLMMIINCDFHCLLQYGSDEFGQDSPRYTSPKAALYADSYYIGKCVQFKNNFKLVSILNRSIDQRVILLEERSTIVVYNVCQMLHCIETN